MVVFVVVLALTLTLTLTLTLITATTTTTSPAAQWSLGATVAVWAGCVVPASSATRCSRGRWWSPSSLSSSPSP